MYRWWLLLITYSIEIHEVRNAALCTTSFIYEHESDLLPVELPNALLWHFQEMGQRDIWELNYTRLLPLYPCHFRWLCILWLRNCYWDQVIELFKVKMKLVCFHHIKYLSIINPHWLEHPFRFNHQSIFLGLTIIVDI